MNIVSRNVLSRNERMRKKYAKEVSKTFSDAFVRKTSKLRFSSKARIEILFERIPNGNLTLAFRVKDCNFNSEMWKVELVGCDSELEYVIAQNIVRLMEKQGFYFRRFSKADVNFGNKAKIIAYVS